MSIDERNDQFRPTMTADFEGLIDIVEDKSGNPAFLLRDGEDLIIRSEKLVDGFFYVPPPKTQIPWILPRAEKILELWELSRHEHKKWFKKLYLELIEFHRNVSELPSDDHYDLIAAWDLHTHLLEPCQYSPIICLHAVADRGKTRTGMAMTYLARHGIVVESLREAYIIRISRDLKAMIFFDVKNISDKAIKNNSEDLLLYRFQRGATVPRVSNPKLGPHQDITYYCAFGATIIGTNTSLDNILESRAIVINMRETSKKFENDITPESCLELKEKLVVFRARYLGIRLPEMPKPAMGRLGDILKPLLQTIELVCPDRKPNFIRLVEELRKGRQIEKLDTLEAQVLRTVISLSEHVYHGVLPIKLITDAFNRERLERHAITYQRMGRILGPMGFQKGKTGDGSSAILWDQKLIERMKESYGLKNSSEKPDTPEKDSGDAGLSGDSDILI